MRARRTVLALVILSALAATARADESQRAYLDGLEALTQLEFERAADAFSRAIDADPENADYRIARGAAACFAQDPERAERDFDRAMKLRPGDNTARMWRAAADRMRARFFTEIYPPATLDPFESTVGEVSILWGNAFGKVEPGYEPSDEARQQARQRLMDLCQWFAERERSAPVVVDAMWERARERHADRDWKGALNDVEAVLATRLHDPSALYVHASCLLALGNAADARRQFTRALQGLSDFAPAYAGRALAAARWRPRAWAMHVAPNGTSNGPDDSIQTSPPNGGRKFNAHSSKSTRRATRSCAHTSSRTPHDCGTTSGTWTGSPRSNLRSASIRRIPTEAPTWRRSCTTTPRSTASGSSRVARRACSARRPRRI